MIMAGNNYIHLLTEGINHGYTVDFKDIPVERNFAQEIPALDSICPNQQSDLRSAVSVSKRDNCVTFIFFNIPQQNVEDDFDRVKKKW
jgi:hypothetical protein